MVLRGSLALIILYITHIIIGGGYSKSNSFFIEIPSQGLDIPTRSTPNALGKGKELLNQYSQVLRDRHCFSRTNKT